MGRVKTISCRVKIMPCILPQNMAYCGNACNTPSAAHLQNIVHGSILRGGTIVHIKCILHIYFDTDNCFKQLIGARKLVFKTSHTFKKRRFQSQLSYADKVTKSENGKPTWWYAGTGCTHWYWWYTGTEVCMHRSQKLASVFELFSVPSLGLF